MAGDRSILYIRTDAKLKAEFEAEADRLDITLGTLLARAFHSYRGVKADESTVQAQESTVQADAITRLEERIEALEERLSRMEAAPPAPPRPQQQRTKSKPTAAPQSEQVQGDRPLSTVEVCEVLGESAPNLNKKARRKGFGSSEEYLESLGWKNVSQHTRPQWVRVTAH